MAFSTRGKTPASVYRLQLNENFTISDAIDLIPYLKELGIEGVYCSPYFEAFSPHGYDITDPTKINPLVASKKEYELFCKSLKKNRMAHIVDIVPNHMGILGENHWWLDVLRNGESSKYAKFFDIDWEQEKIHIGILGASLEDELKKGRIKREGDWIIYGKVRFPINPKTKRIKKLDQLLEAQHYRLADWLSSAQSINYRRFFNINELVGVRVEDESVLKAHHKLIFQLIKKKKIQGLRVDHPDGLYDPKEYFKRLRKRFKGLIVVEKILGRGEDLPSDWGVDGTVGYEYLNMLTGLFVQGKGEKSLTTVYENFIGQKLDLEKMLIEKKKFFTASEMAADVRRLGTRLFECGVQKDLTVGIIIQALYEVLAYFPVYRTYISPTDKTVPKRDLPYIKEALQKARQNNRELGMEVFDFLDQVLLLEKEGKCYRDFIMQFQQLSAPIMAKGMEDITLYNYNRLLSLNEVGGEPGYFGVSSEEFHKFCMEKQKKWPLGFLTTSTHDTKRSLDVRMQLSVLSEMPLEWKRVLKIWSRMNEKHKTEIDGKLFPEPNMEYFLYQILLGVWVSKPSASRIWASIQKSIKEARMHTSWRHPDEHYEKACKSFVEKILKKGNPFLRSFEAFHKKIVAPGLWNSLCATVLKIGSPGIIDVYEGCESWRFTLVDPDNRTPVDFTKLQSQLPGDEDKLLVHRIGLKFRKQHRDLFLKGKYVPLEVEGAGKDHVIAFMRTYGKQKCLVATGRFFTKLKGLKTTEIILPRKLGEGVEIFSKRGVKPLDKRLNAEALFENAPYAMIYWEGK